MPFCDDGDVGVLTKCSVYYYNFYDRVLSFLSLVMRCFLFLVSLLTLLCQTVRAQSVFAHVIVCLPMSRRYSQTGADSFRSATMERTPSPTGSQISSWPPAKALMLSL